MPLLARGRRSEQELADGPGVPEALGCTYSLPCTQRFWGDAVHLPISHFPVTTWDPRRAGAGLYPGEKQKGPWERATVATPLLLTSLHAGEARRTVTPLHRHADRAQLPGGSMSGGLLLCEEFSSGVGLTECRPRLPESTQAEGWQQGQAHQKAR